MRETADIETSSDGYARRFSGPAGEWMLGVQTSILLSFLRDIPKARILDVGGGHAQAALPLLNAGHHVVVLGSDPSCAQRLKPHLDNCRLTFVSGSLTEIPFEDNAFDVVLSLRLIPHCEQWQTLLREMCRVASGRVIFDYPSVESMNCLAGLFFERKKKFEGNTRTWLSFKNREISAALKQAGWDDLTLRKQFFWPMAVHRMLNRPSISKVMEGTTAAVGLRHLFGSPVLVCAQRN